MENADRYDDPAVDTRASGPGSGLGVQEGERARRTDAKIAENAARGLQADTAESRGAHATGTAGTASGAGQGLSSSGLTGQSGQGGVGQSQGLGGQQGYGQGQQQQSSGLGGAGGVGGQSGQSGQSGLGGSGQRDPYDRPPVEGQFNMQNADRYDDPSVDPRATGPGSGFGLSEGQQARQTDARMAGQGQQR